MLKNRKEALVSQRNECIGLLETQYTLGRRIGAHQLPAWMAIFRICSGMLLIMAVCLLATAAFSEVVTGLVSPVWLSVICWLGLSTLWTWWTLLAWIRPGVNQLFAIRGVIWSKQMRVGGNWRPAEPVLEQIRSIPIVHQVNGSSARNSIQD